MPNRNVNVIFMGSPDFAVPTLDSLVQAPEFDIIRVVTQPDRPKGRGRKLSPTPVKERAIANGIPVLTMTKRDYNAVANELTALDPDFVVVAAFGVILKNDILDLPKHGCVNLHASLLPKYRGVSPVQTAIMAGDEETGCTTMLMDAGIDTGDILLTKRIRIDPEDTTGSLEAKLSELGAPLVVKTLRGLLDGTIGPKRQNDDLASYTKKIRKEHGLVDWSKSAEEIARQVRAMRPWPTAYTSFSDKRLIILGGCPSDVSIARAEPGTVVSLSPFVIATGGGTLEVTRVKVEGKKEVPAQAFVSGYRVSVGDRLG
ncbi:MAG: methionyl-tRNA formyltransferase [Candidatus Latescibacterota bacterium]|nr:MAG: methionyl-tRNA formyltransferase [Candidatus Latescibacterota bacterium]